MTDPENYFVVSTNEKPKDLIRELTYKNPGYRKFATGYLPLI
jgi:hypothetical protein